MVVTAAGLAFIAAVEAAEVLRAGGEVALGGGAQYIRDGRPVGVAANLGLALARVACRRYGSDPASYPSDTALNYEKACRPYLDDVGFGSGPSLELPFRGGQCSAPYVVTTTRTSNLAGTSTAVLRVLGPVGGARAREVSPGNYDWELFCSGIAFGFVGCGPVQNTGARWYRIGGFNSSDGNVSVTIDSIQACGSDDCGNPDPEVRQPTAPTIVLPPIVPIIIAPDIDVDARVEVNIDGTIDIDLGTGDITIDPFGDDDNSGGGGDSGADDSPPAPEPGADLPGGNGGLGGDDLFGEPPAGRRWVGCCITITARPTNQPPIPNTIPEDVYASVVGNIRLVYDAAGTRQTDTPVRIQARKVCVWEAVRKLNPVGVSVDLQPGFGYRYRPYSVPLDA